MDQEIRNKLRNVVTQCRRLLEEDVRQVLEGKYGIFAKKDQVTADPNAPMAHLSEEEQTARKDILDHFAHIEARSFKPKDALDQLVREIAFTHLNRFCAYKMMEAREVYVGGQKFREAVSRGINSNGVKFYLAEHPEEERHFNTGHQDVAYRHFLDWLGGLLSEEIGVLFSPTDPANRLYPRQKTLDEVLDLLNSGGIKPDDAELREQWPKIWSQDETIGWVYQYFTPKELRDAARDPKKGGSQAPRNSYELAFRNQFFTPRYIVEFLTDNTLGRIWYEMRRGDTKLKNNCRCMVRRPTEIFLNDGEKSPNAAADERRDLAQEQVLNLPEYVQYRGKKDPRELKILDPASGSGHFLLYGFDLLLMIYDEAYADSDLGPALQKDYPTLDDFRREVPRLILAHNLHGIDIDLRASQIAALALWLRCQRAYQEMGLKKDRPKITRSNFVCAEPMPGEKQMLKEFVGQLEPRLLGQLVEVVFDKMTLAGEAGSLLKIEEEINDAVAEARRQWIAGPKEVQGLLFGENRAIAQQQRFDFSGVTDAQFFEQAESKVVEALRSYAEKAHVGQRLQRRLFTEDAVRGFGFIDICHKRFDVVLMNPPFGDSSKPAKGLIEKQYPRTKNDIYAAFVEQGLSRLVRGGLLGAITSRTGFFLSSFQKWREEILLNEANPTVFADLGHGVLDTAMVETAAYCVEARPSASDTIFFRLLKADDKETALLDAITAVSSNRPAVDVFQVDSASFQRVPSSPFAYWVSERIRGLFHDLPPFDNEAEGRATRCGLGTTDNFRFLRLNWEVPLLKKNIDWIPYYDGGVYSPVYDLFPLVVWWRDNGREIKEFVAGKFGSASRKVQGEDYYKKPGFVFPRRTKGLCPKVMAAGGIFSNAGQAGFVPKVDLFAAIGLLTSEICTLLVSLSQGRTGDAAQFEVGLIKRLPWIGTADREFVDKLSSRTRAVCDAKRQGFKGDELAFEFVVPHILLAEGNDLKGRIAKAQTTLRDLSTEVANCLEEINTLVLATYQIAPEDRQVQVAAVDQCLVSDSEADIAGEFESSILISNSEPFVQAVISYVIGVAFGRWDIRFATGELAPAPLPDPFDPVPAFSPGMLLGANHLPLESPPEGYPLRINGEGILVDDADHPDDILRRGRDVFEAIWDGRAAAIEKEACEILRTNDLRDYLRNTGHDGFWDVHLSQYSKRRRSAPIYWPLQSSKKNYVLWLYYHRLDNDILFKALVNYVEPKIRLEASRLETLRIQKSAAGESGKESTRHAKEVERQEGFLSELRDFEDKLRRAANLHLEPDLNDGVVLNIAPLHELVPWKEAKNYWDELLEGKYEWSSIGKQLRQKGLVK